MELIDAVRARLQAIKHSEDSAEVERLIKITEDALMYLLM